MALELFYHPFSSYSWKVLIPLYEAGTPFEPKVIGNPATEYLDMHYPAATPMLPADPAERLEVRLLDRFFDNYVHAPMQAHVGDRIRQPEGRDPQGVKAAGAMLDKSYAWLDQRMAGREWAVGDNFTLADCAAAPPLFYGSMVVPFEETQKNLAAYFERLKARPSFARVRNEAEPYFQMVPKES